MLSNAGILIRKEMVSCNRPIMKNQKSHPFNRNSREEMIAPPYRMLFKLMLRVFAVLIAAHLSSAAVLSPRDSLTCTATGGAALRFLHGAGSKTSEGGLLTCGLDHTFTDNIQAFCALRVGRNTSRPLLEEARVRWTTGKNETGFGFISHRYGFAAIYRPYSLFNLLFDKPVLWDSYGFGFDYRRNFSGRLTLAAASSINTRENGQAHLSAKLKTGAVESILLGGFQTYSLENQDNSLSAGMDVTTRLDSLIVHGTAVYMHYLGYGHATNPTMIPGESITGFLELSFALPCPVKFNAMSYYQKSRKRYDHEFLFGGMECSWMFIGWCGIGLGGEVQKDDDVVSIMPRFFTDITPHPESLNLQISLQPTVLHKEVIDIRAAGEFRIRI